MTSTISIHNKTPNTVPGFELEEIDGELLLYSPELNRSIHMNSAASLIWRLCDGKVTVAELIELLASAFPESKDSIEQDVSDTIDLLVQHGAVQLVG